MRGRIALLVAVLAWPAAAISDLADDFAREAAFENVVISPSGKYLAVVFRNEGQEFVGVIETATQRHLTQFVAGERLGVARLVWANDERLLMWPAERYPIIDWKAPTGEILGVNADGLREKLIYGWRAGRSQLGSYIRSAQTTHGWATLVDLLPDDPNHIMIASHPFSSRDRAATALRLDVLDGRQITEAISPVAFGDFVCAPDGNVRLAFGTTPDDDYARYRRAPGEVEFRLVMKRGAGQGRVVPIKAYDDRRFLAVDDLDSTTAGLSIWNAETGERQHVFRNDHVDVDAVAFDGTERVPYAVRVVDHFPDYFYPDADHPLAIVHKGIRRAFSDDDVTLTSVTRDNALAVAFVHGDRNPGAFYLVDVKARSLSKIDDARPWLDRDRLAKEQPIALVVRDQTPVAAYLTEPNGFQPPGPLVVLVHGGPHGIRDRWGFDREAQLLAAAGYAVLQVNYRGSGGYGRAFEAAGYREWGRAMQNDVTDATRWAIAEHIADPRRICIFGASYGGYAALTGAFEEPDLYRCAIGYSGVYDLPLMFEKGDVQAFRSGESYLRKTLGDDVEDLKSRSPAYNAARIKAKVMLVHGRWDERAPIAHAERMRAALQRAGNEPEWIVESGEGHGFFDPKNVADLYRRILAFLDRNIGASAVKPD